MNNVKRCQSYVKSELIKYNEELTKYLIKMFCI